MVRRNEPLRDVDSALSRAASGSRMITCFIMLEIDPSARAPLGSSMNVTVRIPDDLAARLAAEGRDLERTVLEAVVADAYRAGRLTRPDL